MTEPTASLTKQEAFNRALAGIRNQGYQRSIFPDGRGCAMKGPNGTKCAIAHAYLEGDGTWSPALQTASRDASEWAFITSLRRCHDETLAYGAEAFEDGMMALAAYWELDYSPPGGNNDAPYV